MSSRLYVCAVPGASQTRGQSRARQRLASLGLLESDTGAVEAIATEPGEQRLQLQYRGRYAEKMAAELDELATASGIDAVPYYATDESVPADGYYNLSNATTGRTDPRASELTDADLTLTRQGTRASHRRRVATTITQPNHPFGNDLTAFVGVPAMAGDVQWHDPATHATSDASLVATRSAELGDVAIYDAQVAPYDAPDLVYNADYGAEGPVDVRVWDERDAGPKLDSAGVLQWAKCFITSHQFSGDAILDNGLVRLRFDEAAALTVERWDDGAGSWTSQALGASDWSFHALDIRHIGMARVEAVVEFADTTQSPTARDALRCILPRGYADPIWAERDGGMPSGLVDLLEPVASAQAYVAGADKGLLDRSAL